MTDQDLQTLSSALEAFKEEAELFFVTEFYTSPKLEAEYSFCLDVIFNITGEHDTNRGLIAFNTRYGQGKSFFFDVLNHRYRRLRGRNLFVKTSAKELAEIYKSAGDKEDPTQKLEAFIKCKNLFIDDIGDEGESKVFAHYSNKLNVVRHVLLKRYLYWTDNGYKTYGTTNLTIDQIASNYDGRVSDRLLLMCYWREFFFLDAGSFRQIKGSRMLTQEERAANLKRVAPIPKEEVAIDLTKYLNELLEDPGYIAQKEGDFGYWAWIGDLLYRRKLMKKRPPLESEFIAAKALLESPGEPNSNKMKAIKKVLTAGAGSRDFVLLVAEGTRGLKEFKKLIDKNHKFVDL